MIHRIKTSVIFRLYMMGLIRRETPFELVLEEEPKPGFYIWCSRDYSRLHCEWIRKK